MGALLGESRRELTTNKEQKMTTTTTTTTTELRYCPGNATSYHLLYTVMGNERVLTWLKHGGSGGGMIRYYADAYICSDYLADKMDIRTGDASPLAKWIEDKQEEEQGQ